MKCTSMAPIAVTWTIIVLVAGCASQVAALVCRPASEGRLKNITGAYDAVKFPAAFFRSDMDIMYFQVWPENITEPRFKFPCQDNSNLSLVNFTATCDETTGRLDPRPYYDVGAADGLRPYYKHWSYSEIIPTTDIQLFCERNDMRRLYSHRVWKKTIIPAVITAIVIVIILEFAAILSAFLWSWIVAKIRPSVPQAWWPDLGLEDTIADWIHLLMLVIAGFCMIEGVSHSSTMSWRSTCMLDAAVVYTYLTFFSLISSLLRQVACAIKTNREMDVARPIQLPTTTSSSGMNASPKPKEDEEGKRFVLEQEGNDWRWQRVFNQFAVVMLMTAFLSYNENMAGTALDSLVSVIWSMVVVAGTWSIGVSLVVGARAVTLLAGLAGQRRCSRSFPRQPRPSPP